MNLYKFSLRQISTLHALVVLLSGALAPTLFAQVNIASGGFNSTNVCSYSSSVPATCQVVTNINAMLSGTVLQLTTSAENQVGSAWTAAPQTVKNGFSTSFTFQFTNRSNPPADGIAFVIQNAPSGLAAIGYTGGNGGAIGYGGDDSNKSLTSGILNSLAIEFDSYTNGWDPNANHVAVQSCGIGNNTSHHNLVCTTGTLTNSTLGISTSVGALPITLSDGNVHTVTIQYNPPGTACNPTASTTNNLCIYLDQATYPTPVLTVTADLSTIGLGTGGTAYVGFTGATGGSYETQDILSWNFAATVVQQFNASGPTTADFTTITADNQPLVNQLILNPTTADTTAVLTCNGQPGTSNNCGSIQLMTTNNKIPTLTWPQYVVGTPWATSTCSARPANGIDTCTMYVNACYGGLNNIPASQASDFYCPMATPGIPNNFITIEDIFDLPSPKQCPQACVAPGTTVSLLDFTPATNSATDVWAPSSLLPIPPATVVAPNPVCINPFEPGDSHPAAFQCEVVDSVIQVYGDQTTTKGSKPKKGWIVTVFNVPMLWTQWDVIGGGTNCATSTTHLNNPPVNDLSSSAWFNGACLLQFTVNPAFTTATPPNDYGFRAAPPASITYGLGPAVFPASTDALQTNSSSGLAAIPAQLWTLSPGPLSDLGGLAEGPNVLHWSAQDLVGNSEKNVQLNSTGTCPNPFTGIPDSAPCYTTNLFTTTVNIDSTPPVPAIPSGYASTCNPTGTLGNNGWYRSEVAVVCGAMDVTSGIDHCSGAVASCSPASALANQPVNFTLTTKSGGFASAAMTADGAETLYDLAQNSLIVPTQGPFKIDYVIPIMSVTGFSSSSMVNTPVASPFNLNQVVYPVYSCTDTGSGIANCGGIAIASCPAGTSQVISPAPITTSTAGGPFSYPTGTLTATDCAGNLSLPASPVSYSVLQPTPPADVAVVEQETTDTPKHGATLNYVVWALDLTKGASASNVVVNFSIPAGVAGTVTGKVAVVNCSLLTGCSAMPPSGGSSCSVSPDNTQVSCNIGTLVSVYNLKGAVAKISIPIAAPTGTKFNITATVTSANDPNAKNNATVDTITVK